LEQAVQQARLNGFAVWKEGPAPAYAAPIFDRSGDMIMSISAAAESLESSILLDAAKTLSGQIRDLAGK